MTSTLTQFTITGQAAGYWRATFTNPPIHLIDRPAERPNLHRGRGR